MEPLDEELPDQPAPVLDLDQPRTLDYIPDEPPLAAYQPRAEVQPPDPFDLPIPEGGLGEGRPVLPHEVPPVPESSNEADSDNEPSSHHHAAMPAGDRYEILEGAGRASKLGHRPKNHLLDVLHGYKYSEVNHQMGQQFQ